MAFYFSKGVLNRGESWNNKEKTLTIMIISNSENCFLNNFSILGAAKIEKNIKTDPKLVHFQIIRIKI